MVTGFVIKRRCLLALELSVVNHGLHQHFSAVQINRTAFDSPEVNNSLFGPRLLALIHD